MVTKPATPTDPMRAATEAAAPLVPLQPHIASRILFLRDQRVMLDADLAVLYGVETKILVQAIKRNAERFPADFMFQFSSEEFLVLRSVCDLKTRRAGWQGWSSLCALCVHRAGRGDAVVCA